MSASRSVTPLAACVAALLVLTAAADALGCWAHIEPAALVENAEAIVLGRMTRVDAAKGTGIVAVDEVLKGPADLKEAPTQFTPRADGGPMLSTALFYVDGQEGVWILTKKNDQGAYPLTHPQYFQSGEAIAEIRALAARPAAGEATATGGKAAAPFRTIAIPAREHGYSILEPQVIRSQAELNAMLKATDREHTWNEREAVVRALTGAKIDFNTEALVLLPHVETSGSIRVAFQEPKLDGKTLVCQIERNDPGWGTDDMAYYGFALAVSKAHVDEVELRVEGREPVSLRVGGGNEAAQPGAANVPAFRTVPIPAREHGYSTLEPQVIRTQAELDALLRGPAGRQAWNDRDGFVRALRAANVDFDREALALLPHTEGSGSIRVTFQEPKLDGKTLRCQIDRVVPGIGTADMAYYCFAVVVSKADVDAVELRVEDREPVVLRVAAERQPQ